MLGKHKINSLFLKNFKKLISKFEKEITKKKSCKSGEFSVGERDNVLWFLCQRTSWRRLRAWASSLQPPTPTTSLCFCSAFRFALTSIRSQSDTPMAGRRDALLTRDKNHSVTASRIAVAVFIGVILGCIFAFFSPHGFFTSPSSSPILNNYKVLLISLLLPQFISFFKSHHYLFFNFTKIELLEQPVYLIITWIWLLYTVGVNFSLHYRFKKV